MEKPGVCLVAPACRVCSCVLPFNCPCRAVVFVVDSAAFQREVKDVAEFLYQVLIDSMALKNSPSLLIACNKQGASWQRQPTVEDCCWELVHLPAVVISEHGERAGIKH